MKTPLLTVEDLRVEFRSGDRRVEALSGVSFELYRGEVLGLVGESGSGKTLTSLALLGLLPAAAHVTAGRAVFDGEDLLTLGPRRLREIRGGEIGMVFQDATTALNPVLTVGSQLAEVLRAHDGSLSKKDARARAVELLAEVHVPDPDRRFGQYVHEFSGGMRQRVMIALARANRPRLLIADEPTTALDVTIQAQVLEVLRESQQADTATLLVTHDLGVIAEMADRVAVMYAGQIVEVGTVTEVFDRPRSPYTAGLLASSPRLDAGDARLLPISGNPPQMTEFSSGCRFHPRCDLRRGRERCLTEQPALVGPDGHVARCHFSDELAGGPAPVLVSAEPTAGEVS